MRALVDRVYEGHAAGCCLHVVTDDRNWGAAAFVLGVAYARRHALCAEAAEIMAGMTPKQLGDALRPRRRRLAQ